MRQHSAQGLHGLTSIIKVLSYRVDIYAHLVHQGQHQRLAARQQRLPHTLDPKTLQGPCAGRTLSTMASTSAWLPVSSACRMRGSASACAGAAAWPSGPAGSPGSPASSSAHSPAHLEAVVFPNKIGRFARPTAQNISFCEIRLPSSDEECGVALKWQSAL